MRAIVISRHNAGCCPSIQRSLEHSSVHWIPLGHQSGSDDIDPAGLSMGGSSTTSSSSSESSRSPMPRRPKHDMSAKPIKHFRQRLYSASLIAPPSTDVILISSMSRSTVTCHRGGRIDRHGPACRYIPRSTVRRIISGWFAFSSACSLSCKHMSLSSSFFDPPRTMSSVWPPPGGCGPRAPCVSRVPQIQSQPQDINFDRRVQAKGDRRGHGIFWKAAGTVAN